MSDSRGDRDSRGHGNLGNIKGIAGNSDDRSNTGNIVTRHSDYIYARPVIIDRLAYILPWGKNWRLINYDQDLKKIKRRLKILVEEKVCSMAYVRKSRYQFNIRVQLPGRHILLIQIGAVNPRVQKGGVRVDLNPASLKDGDVLYFHTFMCKLLGRRTYGDLWGRPLINVLHPAVDIIGVHLDDLLVHYGNARQRSAFVKRTNKQGNIEGYNFGSMSSDYVGAVYDKQAERVHRAVEAIARAGRLGNTKMKEAKISQFYEAKNRAPYIRAELRGKKMRGVPLSGIAHLTNRFERFGFVDLKSEKYSAIPHRVRDACISVFRDRGRDAALDLFRGTKHFKAIESWLDGTESPAWWQPERLWEQAVAKLKASGLFPASAFDDRNVPVAASEISSKSKAVRSLAKRPR